MKIKKILENCLRFCLAGSIILLCACSDGTHTTSDQAVSGSSLVGTASNGSGGTGSNGTTGSNSTASNGSNNSKGEGSSMSSLTTSQGSVSSTIGPFEPGNPNATMLIYNAAPGIARTGILDYSWMNEMPAGKHGAVTVKGDSFVFADGTPVKFFGVNIGFAAAAPDKEVAEAMAAELASCGVNFVRLHALDSTYAGIVDYSKSNTQGLAASELDKFDYLVYCLKQKGIYIHLDTNVIHVYKEGDGLTSQKANIIAEAGGYLNATHFFDDRIMELDMQFAMNLVTHVNPYTKMSYAKDPAIAVIQFANESSILWYQQDVNNVFTQELNVKFNKWLLKKYKTRAALDSAWTDADGKKALASGEDPAKGTVKSASLGVWGESLTKYSNAQQARHADWTDFLIETQTATFDAFYEALRTKGYKSAINCSNWAERGADIYLNAQGDVTEKNAYINQPTGAERVGTYPTYELASLDIRKLSSNTNSAGYHTLSALSRASVADKPLIVTEWNVVNPQRFKADALLQMASYGAFQGWDGFCTFLYVFNGDASTYSLFKNIDSIYEIVNDPSMYGQFGMAAMLFREGYVQEAKNSVEVGLTYEDLLAVNEGWYKAPTWVPFVSKFSYRIIENNKYSGDADLVLPSGNVAAGDYTSAKHLLMLSENPFSDAYNKTKGRDAWYTKHTQANSGSLKVGSLSFKIGSKTAICENAGEAGGFYTNGKFYDVLTQVMRRFNLINDTQGYLSDRVVSDTGELTYVYEKNFQLDAKAAAIFAGKTASGKNPVGDGWLTTKNDRAAVSVISMEQGKTLKNSSKLLVYAMGRCYNSNMVMENNVMKFFGSEPVVFENIRGELMIPSTKKTCKVWGLDTLGRRVAQISVKSVSGGFTITLGGYYNYEVELGN